MNSWSVDYAFSVDVVVASRPRVREMEVSLTLLLLAVHF
jgi:hypothetical protein